MILGWPTDFWKVINTALGGGLTPFLTSSPLGIGITGEVTLHAEGKEEGYASSSFASTLTSDDTRGGPQIFWKVINTALGGGLTPFLTSSPLGIGITGEVTLHAEA